MAYLASQRSESCRGAGMSSPLMNQQDREGRCWDCLHALLQCFGRRGDTVAWGTFVKSGDLLNALFSRCVGSRSVRSRIPQPGLCLGGLFRSINFFGPAGGRLNGLSCFLLLIGPRLSIRAHEWRFAAHSSFLSWVRSGLHQYRWKNSDAFGHEQRRKLGIELVP